MRSYALKNNHIDSLMRINDRAVIRKLRMDNRRQRKIIRRYRDAFEIKEIASKIFRFITGMLSKVKDKATDVAFRAVLKMLSMMPSKPVGTAIKDWAKNLLTKIKSLAKTNLPRSIGNQLIKFGELLVKKTQQSQEPVGGYEGAYI